MKNFPLPEYTSTIERYKRLKYIETLASSIKEGGNVVAIKLCLTGLGAFTAAGIRFSIAALVIYIWARYKKIPLKYRDVFEETGKEFAADADLWGRMSIFINCLPPVRYSLDVVYRRMSKFRNWPSGVSVLNGVKCGLFFI